MLLSSALRDQLAQIKLLALDSDGVLTDGGVYMLDDGREFRRFSIKDGLGIKQVQALGVVVAVISASSVAVVRYRAQRLGIAHIYLGESDKLQRLSALCDEHEIDLAQAAYMGDDLKDMEVMAAVGFSAAPADAVAQVRQTASYVTTQAGGHGAVREVCDAIVAVQSQ